jgi:hypothetical protein
MSDYTFEMFNQDQEKMRPILESYYSMEKLDPKTTASGSREAAEQVLNYFVEKYGKRKGWDYEVRFLTTATFIDHYQAELTKLGLISQPDSVSIRIQSDLLQLLLESFKPPQPKTLLPASPLLNQNHEFNYKKVVKALKNMQSRHE